MNEFYTYKEKSRRRKKTYLEKSLPISSSVVPRCDIMINPPFGVKTVPGGKEIKSFNQKKRLKEEKINN
ncbi:MAG TPA: hypothetical protein V6C58_18380 [Allocoleopsis sp.]